MAAVRVRQHVNPLAIKYQRAIDLPDWPTLYGDMTQPLHLDIGCGRGYFLLEMAQEQPDWNFLGLEIREPLIQDANQRAQDLPNLYYLFCNANISLESILASWPVGSLQRVSIQFPDPWFKKRHQKRRVVQPQLLNDLAAYLIPGGQVFVQSDVQAVASDMTHCLEDHAAFIRPMTEQDWLPENPFPVPTEREKSVLSQGKPIYRALFTRR